MKYHIQALQLRPILQGHCFGDKTLDTVLRNNARFTITRTLHIAKPLNISSGTSNSIARGLSARVPRRRKSSGSLSGGP